MAENTTVQYRFTRLVRTGLITSEELTECLENARGTGEYEETLLLDRGIPRHEILFSLSESYGCAFFEYDESTVVSRAVIGRLDMDMLRSRLWVPLSADRRSATVIAYRPEECDDEVRRILGTARVKFLVALPEDIIRTIQNSTDLNPGFPRSAGRTLLARTRTFLSERRSLYACKRTTLSRARTGLAFLRTGLSCIAIALLVARIFGTGYTLIPVVLLSAAGAVISLDGLLWYLPARKGRQDVPLMRPTHAAREGSVLETVCSGEGLSFSRTAGVPGAAALRAEWKTLSPVMRRRFLASDRTDLAEERTVLARYRTGMASARTGLAFARTGIAFVGTGIALFRQFGPGPAMLIDFILIAAGLLMAAEGLAWYVPGRRAGVHGLESVRAAEESSSIWDLLFPHGSGASAAVVGRQPFVSAGYLRGIWGTTGLALERTLLADRRNVMARLRTLMARSRTGLALIRTGMSIAAVGIALLVFFGTRSAAWTAFDVVLVGGGLLFIADGLRWHLPAEQRRLQLPYCYGAMEITLPDYGKPPHEWKRTEFADDDRI